ncbi:MAG TPA: universal stress protein [Polyangiales bacterium]
MTPIKNILCPTDFSPCSDAAVSLAVELAARMGAAVALVHVFQVPIYVGWEDGPAALAATTQFLDESRKRATVLLDALRAKCAQQGIVVTARQVDGLPHLQIAELSEHADLVVMGTHGRTGVSHLMLGSVAERVVRLSKCPVMTVPVRPA